MSYLESSWASSAEEVAETRTQPFALYTFPTSSLLLSPEQRTPSSLQKADQESPDFTLEVDTLLTAVTTVATNAIYINLSI